MTSLFCTALLATVALGLLPLRESFVFRPQTRFYARRRISKHLQVPVDSVDCDINNGNAHDGNRRDTLSRAFQLTLVFAFLPTRTIANAAVMDPSTNSNVFKEGKALTEEEAVIRLREGRKSAQYLLDHYDQICERGGDEVRRYAGTVGTSSGLFGIGKVMTALADRADDFVEYTELSNEVLKSLQQVDGSAYMAIFVTTSTSQTPPSKYFADAKIEVKRAIKALDDLAALIDVQL